MLKIHHHHFASDKPMAKLAHIISFDHIPVVLAKPIAKQMIKLIRHSMGGDSRDVTAGRVSREVFRVSGFREDVSVRCYRLLSYAVRSALVFFHGGGWIGGSLAAVEHFCMAVADRADVVVFSVDYHLAPENVFPVGLEDGYAVAEWLSTQSERFAIDKLYLAGDSAGGNLATVICLLADQRGGFDVAGQLLLYPVVDVRASKNDSLDLAASIYLANRQLRFDWRVSPLVSDQLMAMPPTLLTVGACDQLYDSNLAYAEALDLAGVDVELMVFENTHHAFIDDTGNSPQAEFLADRIGGWIRGR